MDSSLNTCNVIYLFIYIKWMLYERHYRPLSTAVKVKLSIMLRQATDKIFTQLRHLSLAHLVFLFAMVTDIPVPQTAAILVSACLGLLQFVWLINLCLFSIFMYLNCIR